MGMMQVPNINYHLMNRSEAEGRLKPTLGDSTTMGMRMCVVCCTRIQEIWNHTIKACGYNIHNECLLDNIIDNGIGPDGTLWCPLCH